MLHRYNQQSWFFCGISRNGHVSKGVQECRPVLFVLLLARDRHHHQYHPCRFPFLPPLSSPTTTHNPLQSPSSFFFFRPASTERERRTEGPLWIFFPYREITRSTPFALPCPRSPPSSAKTARNVLRAAGTPDDGSEKIQPPICKFASLFNCDIEFLLVIHLSSLVFLAYLLASCLCSSLFSSRFQRRRDGS